MLTCLPRNITFIYILSNLFDQTKPLLKAFASAGVDTKKLYFVAGLSNRFERM